MNVKPMQDCVFVRPDIEKHALIALIRAKQTGTGVVVATGPWCEDLKVGDHIAFGEFVGQELRWEGKDLLVMREQHVLGVLEDA